MTWLDGFLVLLAYLVSPGAVFGVLVIVGLALLFLTLGYVGDRLMYPGHWGYRGEPWWHRWWWPLVGIVAWIFLALPMLIALGTGHPGGLPLYWNEM